MSRQFWSEALAWTTADGTAIANTTTETIIFPNITIPANYMQDGRVLRVHATGRYSVTGTPTLTYALRWGGVSGTIIAQSGAIQAGSGVTNAQFEINLWVQTRSNGATGSVFVQGHGIMHEDAVPVAGTVTNYGMVFPMGSAGQATPAAVTVDLTADTALSITADWSAASASNTLTGHVYVVEGLN